MLTRYREQVAPQLLQHYAYPNVMQVPRLVKIVVNIGMGEALLNQKAMDAATADLRAITGQAPIAIKARKAVANFKLRAGLEIGLKVTLRGKRMYQFLDKLLGVALPRIRDFRGISSTSFDGHGNYTLGLREQLVFPEIDYDKIDRLRGMEVTLVTTAKNDDEGRALLAAFGFPFRQGGGAQLVFPTPSVPRRPAKAPRKAPPRETPAGEAPGKAGKAGKEG
jgi:large subunit ribosomal protein L5